MPCSMRQECSRILLGMSRDSSRRCMYFYAFGLLEVTAELESSWNRQW